MTLTVLVVHGIGQLCFTVSFGLVIVRKIAYLLSACNLVEYVSQTEVQFALSIF